MGIHRIGNEGRSRCGNGPALTVFCLALRHASWSRSRCSSQATRRSRCSFICRLRAAAKTTAQLRRQSKPCKEILGCEANGFEAAANVSALHVAESTGGGDGGTATSGGLHVSAALSKRDSLGGLFPLRSASATRSRSSSQSEREVPGGKAGSSAIDKPSSQPRRFGYCSLNWRKMSASNASMSRCIGHVRTGGVRPSGTRSFTEGSRCGGKPSARSVEFLLGGSRDNRWY